MSVREKKSSPANFKTIEINLFYLFVLIVLIPLTTWSQSPVSHSDWKERVLAWPALPTFNEYLDLVPGNSTPESSHAKLPVPSAPNPFPIYQPPPYSELLKIVEKNPREPGFDPLRLAADPLQDIEVKVYEFAELMESKYPGLTYAFVGRDTAFLARMVDALYLSIGHPGRVRYLDVSRETLRASPEEILLFLRMNGLQLQSDMSKVAPFIVFDRTDFEINQDPNETSQLLRLTSEVIRQAKILGIPDETLSKKFAPVTFGNGEPLVFSENGRAKLVSRHSQQLWVPAEVMSVDGLSAQIDRIDAHWNDRFGLLEVGGSGRLRSATPGESRQFENSRVNALSMIYEGWQRINGDHLRRYSRSKLSAAGNRERYGRNSSEKHTVLTIAQARAALAAEAPFARAEALYFLSVVQIFEETRWSVVREAYARTPHLQAQLDQVESLAEQAVEKKAAYGLAILIVDALVAAEFDSLHSHYEIRSLLKEAFFRQIELISLLEFASPSHRRWMHLRPLAEPVNEEPIRLKDVLAGTTENPEIMAARQKVMRDLLTEWKALKKTPGTALGYVKKSWTAADFWRRTEDFGSNARLLGANLFPFALDAYALAADPASWNGNTGTYIALLAFGHFTFNGIVFNDSVAYVNQKIAKIRALLSRNSAIPAATEISPHRNVKAAGLEAIRSIAPPRPSSILKCVMSVTKRGK